MNIIFIQTNSYLCIKGCEPFAQISISLWEENNGISAFENYGRDYLEEVKNIGIRGRVKKLILR